MAGERTLNFGADATDARYQLKDTGAGADFAIVDTDTSTTVATYDGTAGEWVLGSNLDASGNDVSGVGSLDAEELLLGGTTALTSVAASGQVQLSSGSATVTTGLSTTDATFSLALGIDDPNADAKIAGRLFWDDSANAYKVEIVEDGTSIGNPTVNYDVLRVR